MKILVIGPEGSGTTMLTRAVHHVVGKDWITQQPGSDMVEHPELLQDQGVYHISLPSHRPAVWLPTRPSLLDGCVAVGAIRSRIDTVYSAWRRFHKEPMGDKSRDTVEDYMNTNSFATLQMMEIIKKTEGFVVSYEAFCDQPTEFLDLIATRLTFNLKYDLGKPDPLPFEVKNQNFKWRDDAVFGKEFAMAMEPTTR